MRLSATRFAGGFATPVGRAGHLVALLGIMACAGDVPVAPPPQVDVSSLYWRLELNHRAITLSTQAPYDTIRLTATPLTASGDPLDASTAATTFTSSDETRLLVSPDGDVRALRTGSRMRIIARMTIGAVTHTDTAVVTVTSVVEPPVLTEFSIQPVPPDSAKGAPSVGLAELYNPPPLLPVRVLGPGGTPIPDPLISVRSSEPSIATVDPSSHQIVAVRPGPVTFHASTTMYGVHMADTLDYTVGYPLAAVTSYESYTVGGETRYRFSQPNLVIATGGYAGWMLTDGQLPIDIEFDEPATALEDSVFCFCGSGNIPRFGDTLDLFGVFALRVRQFREPGRYRFHSPILGASGVVEVVDEGALPMAASALGRLVALPARRSVAQATP